MFTGPPVVFCFEGFQTFLQTLATSLSTHLSLKLPKYCSFGAKIHRFKNPSLIIDEFGRTSHIHANGVPGLSFLHMIFLFLSLTNLSLDLIRQIMKLLSNQILATENSCH